MNLFDSSSYYDLSLEEIYQVQNLNERKYILDFYKRELLKLGDDRLTKKVVSANCGKSINEIIDKLEKIYFDNRSIYTFPNDIVLFHCGIKEFRSKSDIVCDVTGAKINKGSYYYSYRPMFENLSDSHIYVLNKTIKAEITELDFFPTTIYEFDILNAKIDSAYSRDIDDEYDYYDISRRIGGSLTLRKLR